MKDLRQFIKTTIREFLNENNQIYNRVDNALDWMNKYDIKISNKTFQDYVEFTNKNYNKIENLVKEINRNGYIWSSDLPMFFITTLDDLENNNTDLGEINIYKQKVEIFYKYTHVGNNPYEKVSDRYTIIYRNENGIDVTDEISSDELIELLEKNVIMTERGIIGLSQGSVKKYIQNL
jgi:hypothetical protein